MNKQIDAIIKILDYTLNETLMGRQGQTQLRQENGLLVLNQNGKQVTSQQPTGEGFYQNGKNVQDATGIALDRTMLQVG